MDTSDGTGTIVRRDAAGQLVSRIAEATTAGAVALTAGEAEARAVAFLERELPGFAGGDYRVAEAGTVSHLAGDALWRAEWRTQSGGIDGPAAAEIEVDRRTGEVVYYARAAASDPGRPFTVSEEQAARTAITFAGGGTVVSTRRRVWDGSQWLVELDLGTDAHGVERRSTVTIDAATGAVLRAVTA